MSYRRSSASVGTASIESLEPRQLLAGVSPTEVLAQVGATHGLRVIDAWLKRHPQAGLNRVIQLRGSTQLFRTGKTSTLQIKLKPGAAVKSAIKGLKKLPGVRWVSPNYQYASSKGESTPDDPRFGQQVDHLNLIQAPQAWDTTIGAGVTVAVLDDGVDIEHEDLAANIWRNAGEIAGNNIDDDHNGYIDDVNGWDFGSGDNNPRPVLDQQYNIVNSHGTLVASILGAAINNGKGIAGVAGGVKIIPVRFQGTGVTVTSAGLAQSLAYAANNGAKVINISFSIDPYQNDPAFVSAVDLVHSKGVIWLNSAGNSNVANPPRLAIEKALFIANTQNNDQRADNSNYGDGIDLSAPGVELWGAVPGNAYQPAAGTSFSTAVSSATAALIWAAHPAWSREQVVAQLIGSTDNIDAQNPTFIGQLGTGRVNAFKAVGAQVGAPRVRGLKGIADGATVAEASSLTLNLFNALSASTVVAANFELRYAGGDGAFNSNDTIVPLTLANGYFYGTNQLRFTPSAALQSGLYRFTAKKAIKDPFNQALDGNKDGVAGDDYVTTFTLAIPAPAAPAAPDNLVAVLSSAVQSEAELTWKDSSGNETGFIIERSLSDTFATIDKTLTAPANSVRYNDWGLEQGKTYYYRIKGVNAVGTGAPGNTAVLAIPAPPPGAPATPTGLNATAPSYSLSEVELRWIDASNNETGFVIERSKTSNFATIDKTLPAGANTTRYNDWGLSAGQTYYYRIKAINGPDSSPWSSVVNYLPPAPTTAPAAPSNLKASQVAWSDTELQLTWTDNSTNETSLVIQRSTNFLFIGATSITTTPAVGTGQYNDWNLARRTTYYYRVRAANAVGNSAWSNTVSIKTR